MKAKGVEVSLSTFGNAGFTLPSNIGELGGDITKLDLLNFSLTGLCSTGCGVLTFQALAHCIDVCCILEVLLGACEVTSQCALVEAWIATQVKMFEST